MSSCRVNVDWAYKGMKVLILENEYLRVVCLPDKGSDIMEILFKPLSIDFLWHSPIGYRNLSGFKESCSRSDGSFLDYYGGGWQDILPSAGLPSKHRGAEWGQHGETALMPWQCVIEKEKPQEVKVHLTVSLYRYPFSVDKWLVLKQKEKSFTIKEKITNNSEQDLEFSWLQHVAFGEPFLKPGNVINVAAETSVVHSPEIPNSNLPPGKEFSWPSVKDKKGKHVDLSVIPDKKFRAHDLVYLTDVKEGWYALTNAEMKLTFGLVWDKNVFPHIWFWRPLGGAWDHPWFGRAWAVALEPSTSWPATGLADQVKKGTAPKLEGGSSLETEMRAVAHTGLCRVSKISREGTVKGVSG